jgi:hypothetical protein
LALPIRFFKIVFIYIYLRSGGKAALRMSAPTPKLRGRAAGAARSHAAPGYVLIFVFQKIHSILVLSGKHFEQKDIGACHSKEYPLAVSTASRIFCAFLLNEYFCCPPLCCLYDEQRF